MNEQSNCCKARLITVSSDEGTSYYMCSACKNPCDMASEQSMNETEKELIERFRKIKSDYQPNPNALHERVAFSTLIHKIEEFIVEEVRTAVAEREKEIKIEQIKQYKMGRKVSKLLKDQTKTHALHNKYDKGYKLWNLIDAIGRPWSMIDTYYGVLIFIDEMQALKGRKENE